MRVEAVDPETGKTIEMDCVADSHDEIRDLLSFDLSEEALKKRLDNLWNKVCLTRSHDGRKDSITSCGRGELKHHISDQ